MSVNFSNKKFSIALATMLATSTVIATTPFAASASCSSPLNSVTTTGCAIAVDENFTINSGGGVALTTENDGISNSAVNTQVDDYSGLITNNGTISFANADDLEDIDFNGIRINNLVTFTSGTNIISNGTLGSSGSIVNNGTISFTALTTDDIDAYGIRVDEDNNGTITNNGTISISGISTDDSATGYGIYVSNISNGSITNNGTIDINIIAQDSSEANAYGIYIAGNLIGEITNNGTINANATVLGDLSDSSMEAIGIRTSDVLGTLTNNGSITVSAIVAESDDYSAEAIGIQTGDVIGSVINNGTITAFASNTDYSAEAYGIDVNGNLDGALINTGTINTTAVTTQDSSAEAYGIDVGFLNGALTNSGTINATATGEDSDATAYGINVFLLDGTLTNSGTINATANNESSAADGYGVRAFIVDTGGIVNNSGNITVHADSTDNDDSSYGIWSFDMSGTINNSGTIIATNNDNDGNAYSLYIAGGEGGGVINNSGILSGNLSVGGEGGGDITVNNTGSILLPSAASAYIDFNYTQSATGILGIGVQSTDNYATLAIANNANFTTGTKLRVTLEGGNTYAGGSLLNVVDVDGTLTSSANFAVLDNSLAYNFTGVKDGDTIDITSTATDLTTLADAMGGGAGGGAASVLEQYLDGTTTPPVDLLPLLDILGSAEDDQDVQNAIAQTLPLLAGGVEQAIIDSMDNTNKVIESRQENVSGLSSGDEAEADRAVWLKTFGSWATQDATDGTAGYDANSYGVVLGGDKLVSEDVRLGVAAVYSKTNIDVNSSVAPQNNDINSYQGVVYGTYSLGELTDLNFQADIGMNQNEGERNILAVPAVAQSEYDSWSHHIGTAVRHLMTMNESTSFIPSASLDFTNISTDGYTETGAGGLNLNVAEDDQQSLVFGVDGKVEHRLSDAVAVNANLGAGYDMLADRSSITANYVGGGGTFVTNGIDKDPLMLNAGAGIVLDQFHGVEVSAKYDIEARTSDYTNQTASIKLRMPF